MRVRIRKKNEVDEIIKAEDVWEPVGPTPMPELPDLRNWDMRLLKTYKPFYSPSVTYVAYAPLASVT